MADNEIIPEIIVFKKILGEFVRRYLEKTGKAISSAGDLININTPSTVKEWVDQSKKTVPQTAAVYHLCKHYISQKLITEDEEFLLFYALRKAKGNKIKFNPDHLEQDIDYANRKEVNTLSKTNLEDLIDGVEKAGDSDELNQKILGFLDSTKKVKAPPPKEMMELLARATPIVTISVKAKDKAEVVATVPRQATTVVAPKAAAIKACIEEHKPKDKGKALWAAFNKAHGIKAGLRFGPLLKILCDCYNVTGAEVAKKADKNDGMNYNYFLAITRNEATARTVTKPHLDKIIADLGVHESFAKLLHTARDVHEQEAKKTSAPKKVHTNKDRFGVM